MLTRTAALLFDLDGLMIDSEPVWFAVQSEFVRARGGVWSRALAATCIGRGLPNSLRVMQAEFGFPVHPDRDVPALIDAFIAHMGHLALMPGCREILDAATARNLPCAVASSSTKRLVEAALHRFGLLDRFGAVVSGECVARAKPWPDIFLEAAARLGAPAPGCTVLEDSMAGVEAARAAGMSVIAVPEGDRGPFVPVADAVVGDLHAARALLAI